MKNLIPVLLALLMFNACTANSNTGKYTTAKFPLELPEGSVEGKDVTFGYVTVPEFHGKSNGSTMEIAVAVFHSYSAYPAPDPLVLLGGGPGESNISSFTGLLCGEAGKLMRSNRDVVLIEIRGTCLSKPSLICPEVFECEREMHKLEVSADEMLAFMTKSVKTAHDRFKEAGINLAAFNNSEIADDIDMVMKALEYKKYGVFGFSAGTITVQYLLERYPESLSATIMTGVVSLEDNLAASGANTIATLENIFKICEADEKSRSAFPDLENRFLHLLDSLNAHPVPIQLQDENGEEFTYLVTGDKISRWLAFGMYMNNQVPLTVSKFLQGDYSEFTSSLYNAAPQETFSHGLSFSIMASEFVSSLSNSYPYSKKYESFYNGLTTAWHSPQFNKKMGEAWDIKPLELNYKPPVNDVPTLMLCAEFDHVCPPKYAEALTAGLSNSYLYLFKGLAHTQVALTPCLMFMMHEFMNDPSKAPDGTCAQQYQNEFVTQLSL